MCFEVERCYNRLAACKSKEPFCKPLFAKNSLLRQMLEAIETVIAKTLGSYTRYIRCQTKLLVLTLEK